MDNKKSKGVVDRKIEESTTKKENNEQEKREKKMSTAQKMVPVLIVVSVSLAIILLATLIAFFQLKTDNEQNSRTLETVYASSYFTMVDGINNLQVDSAKFESLQNSDSQRKSLKKMEQDCNYVLLGLNILPIEAESCMGATKFFNQINGLCEAYINQIDEGKDLSTEQVALVSEMSFVLGNIKSQFNTHNSMINQVGYSFIDASIFNDKGINEFSTTLGSLKADDIDYPVMIFDGPFSASLESKDINGLSTQEVSQEDAKKYVQEKVFYGVEDLTIKYVGKTTGDFETYDFNCVANKIKFDVQITVREGKLLTLVGYADSQDAVLSMEKAIKLAEKTAERLGFENMQSVWHESQYNIAYINLAPVVDGVIYYPDLVKIKIDLGNQIVLGVEAQNYCYNHITRSVKTNINESSARSIITGDYHIKDVNLAYIPMDDGSEVLCYEIVAEGIDGNYYFYVNAQNKVVEKILKIVNQKGENKLI